MNRIWKRLALLAVFLAVSGFLAYLYFLPPFPTLPPEALTDRERAAAPSLDQIADPVERAIAERGKYIVMATGCFGCHQMPGPQGAPMWDQYLGGGVKSTFKNRGTYFTRNLTSDPTGLKDRTDEDILRVLRSGVFADGRSILHRAMPWSSFSNWSEEDRRAVVTFLRHVKPVRHVVPDPGTAEPLPGDAIEGRYGFDYGRSVK